MLIRIQIFVSENWNTQAGTVASDGLIYIPSLQHGPSLGREILVALCGAMMSECDPGAANLAP